MPTYDYVCDACEHQFELFQSITEDAKRKCPECGKSKLRRLIGPGAAIVFKGSGFYKTDYRSESYKKAAAADKRQERAAPTAPPSPRETGRRRKTKESEDPQRQPQGSHVERSFVCPNLQKAV